MTEFTVVFVLAASVTSPPPLNLRLDVVVEPEETVESYVVNALMPLVLSYVAKLVPNPVAEVSTRAHGRMPFVKVGAAVKAMFVLFAV